MQRARLTVPDLEIIPPPTETYCEILSPDLCAILSKDTFTIITNAFATLQLTWVTMLVVVQLVQISRAQTTFENMRGQMHVHGAAEAITSAMTAGTTSLEDAQLTNTGAGPDPAVGSGRHGRTRKEGCFEQWKRLLGLDTVIATAMYGSKAAEVQARQQRNPFNHGCVTNCRDFWLDPRPVFGKRENGSALLGGESVNYVSMYDVPRMTVGRGGNVRYETIDTDENV